MKRKLYILNLLVLTFLSVFPQETKIIGIIDGSYQNNDAIQIVTFDYENSISDTLCTIEEDFWVKEFATAIDLHRNIYYVMEAQHECTPPPKIVYAINLTTHEIIPVADLDDYACLKIYALFYDMFNNRLIYKDVCAIKSYDLSTGENQMICPIDYTLSYFYGNVTTYNPITNKLVYIEAKDSLNTTYESLVTIDISAGIIEKKITLDYNTLRLSNLTCDILNDKYYAKNSLTDSIIEFDPFTGHTMNIAPMCKKNWGSDISIFDYYNNMIITPIGAVVNSNLVSLLDIVNPSDKSSNCIAFPQIMAEDHLFSGKDIFLKLENNCLVASKSDDYTWYCNGSQVPDADSQYFAPTQSGYYKYSTNIEGEDYYSNEILYLPTSMNLIDIDKEINVYPNPISDELNIEFPQALKGLKTFILYDLYGTTIFSAKTETLINSYKIITNPGIYYLKIILEDNKAITKKVIVI